MGIFSKVWDLTTDVLHAVSGVPTADEKRNAARMVSDQINAYKQQTQLADEMISQKRDQELAEKRRLDEKFVSSIRARRSGGFLGSGDTASFPDTLGG